MRRLGGVRVDRLTPDGFNRLEIIQLQVHTSQGIKKGVGDSS